jgi:hypothetical protein
VINDVTRLKNRIHIIWTRIGTEIQSRINTLIPGPVGSMVRKQAGVIETSVTS